MSQGGEDSGSVLSTAGRNCCNYTAHSTLFVRLTLRKGDFTTGGPKQRPAHSDTSYRFTFFLFINFFMTREVD